MNKRYQVFVSSTFEDLKEERQAIMQALLELHCFPAGMELFPASDDDQWELIRRVIDDADYYVVIVGGRYGSQTREGISFTEKEYRYALQIGKPILGFVHANPGKIVSEKTEESPEGRMKLESFRSLVKGKPVKYWSSPEDLGSKLSRAVSIIIQEKPGIGWVRGDQALDESQVKEILNLQIRNRELQSQIEALGQQDAGARLATLGPLGIWLIKRMIHPDYRGFHCSSDGECISLNYEPKPGRVISIYLEAKTPRMCAEFRRVACQLRKKNLIEEAGLSLMPSIESYDLGLQPLSPDEQTLPCEDTEVKSKVF